MAFPAAVAAGLPWLMRGAKAAWPWLTRGRGMNIPLGGRMGIPRAAGPTRLAPGSRDHTPVNRVLSAGPHRGREVKYQPDPKFAPPRVIEDKAGFARRHPFVTAGTAVTGIGTGYGMMAGDDEPMVAQAAPYVPNNPWSAPSDMANFAEQQELLAAQGKEELGKMLNYGFFIAAAGGKTDKFFERGMAIMEQSKAYKESKHFADVVRAVYKDGDMPKNARIAYERLTPLVGPEQAAILSGHQLGMEEGKTKEERIWNQIMELAQNDIDGASAMLVNAWGTGRLRNPPAQQNQKMRMEIARNMIQAELGVPQLAEGVQSLEVTSA
tara:strand:- start:1575 stop:2546 length:972 start_codon:yes stop_codon:yes gene_type:complete